MITNLILVHLTRVIQLIPLIFLSVNMYNFPPHAHTFPRLVQRLYVSLQLGIYIKFILRRGRRICLNIKVCPHEDNQLIQHGWSAWAKCSVDVKMISLTEADRSWTASINHSSSIDLMLVSSNDDE